jgi:hypothetical protein
MAREPVKYEILPETPVAPCKGCGATIAWVKTAAGKMMPVDGDGTPHFATCPKAAEFRRGRG